MRFAYLLIRLLRRPIPASIFFRLMAASGWKNSAEERPEEYFQTLQNRLDEAGADLAGKHVLEFGSGRYARLSIRILHAGARRVSMADFYAVPLDHPRHRQLLGKDCAELGLGVDDLLQRINLITGDFLASSPSSAAPGADLVISRSTLEHVHDPLAVFEKCFEWLEPGGWMSHSIDLRDHLFKGLEMLTYSERVWTRWLDPSGGFHLNRWRLPDFLQAIREAGFIEIHYETLQESKEELKKVRHRLDERFLSGDVDSLSTMVVHVFARKPTRTGLG